MTTSDCSITQPITTETAMPDNVIHFPIKRVDPPPPPPTLEQRLMLAAGKPRSRTEILRALTLCLNRVSLTTGNIARSQITLGTQQELASWIVSEVEALTIFLEKL